MPRAFRWDRSGRILTPDDAVRARRLSCNVRRTRPNPRALPPVGAALGRREGDTALAQDSHRQRAERLGGLHQFEQVVPAARRRPAGSRPCAAAWLNSTAFLLLSATARLLRVAHQRAFRLSDIAWTQSIPAGARQALERVRAGAWAAAFGIASSVSHSSDFRVQKSREMGPVSKTVPNSSWTHSVPRAGLLEFLRVLGDEVSKPIGTCAKCLAQALYPFRASPWRIQREACARSVQSGGCV